jgi:dephospho-CoA kinase
MPRPPMKVIGLTGGVGMGKSTAADFLRALGAQVVDTDDIARQLVEPGQPAFEEIQKQFGDGIVSPVGGLNRAELAQIVFTDTAARKKLEAILHPRIRERWLAQIETWRSENCGLAVVVIPLLYETQAESQFDKIVCVACSAAEQRKRLSERGWSPDQIRRRIAAQMPVEQKIARADFVVWTDGALEMHRHQIAEIIGRTG